MPEIGNSSPPSHQGRGKPVLGTDRGNVSSPCPPSLRGRKGEGGGQVGVLNCYKIENKVQNILNL